VTQHILYEFPLNERIRVFMRLEQLFLQLDHFLTGATIWDTRAAIDTLLDILTIFSRNDLKSETLKELDRHANILGQIAHHDNVDRIKVGQILEELTMLSKAIYGHSGKIGQALLENDLFQSISQRSAIPGGTGSFDLPAYHFWLEQDKALQKKNLQQWIQQFSVIRKGIMLILDFIRQSGVPSQETARAGFFQKSLDSSLSYQLLRVAVDHSVPCYAEISGGKHRFSVRFMTPSNGGGGRPVQSPDDIPFALTCCLF